MTEPDALLQWGPIDNWPTKTGPAKSSTPLDGIGVRLGPGSWARWNGWESTRTIRVFPSPDAWDSPGLWSTVEQWAGRKTPTARPAVIPWGNGWGGPGGFTLDQDNGIMIDLAPDRAEGWELLGLRRATILDRFLIGMACRTAMPADGCYVADRINQRRPGVVPKGAMGPWWWQQGVIGPEMLRGAPGVGPLRIVMHNVAFGPTAVAAPGAWVEHPLPGQPYGPNHPVVYPEGSDQRMADCGTRFTVEINDARIGRWLDDYRVPKGELRTTKGMFAEYLAREGMQLMVTGTGNPHAVACSGVNPQTRRAWADIGMVDDQTARELGRGLFRYATIGVAT